MSSLRQAITCLLAVSMLFHFPFASAKDVAFPPLSNLIFRSKSLPELIEKSKVGLTTEQYEFLKQKAEQIPTTEMPKARELKPGNYEFILQKHKVSFATLSADQQSFKINGKKLDLAKLSLEERFNLIRSAVLEQKSSSYFDFALPRAHADGGITLGIAVLGATLGVIIRSHRFGNGTPQIAIELKSQPWNVSNSMAIFR